MAFIGIINAHWPSPNPTADRSRKCSLRTATWTNQEKARVKPTLPWKSGVDGTLHCCLTSKFKDFWKLFCNVSPDEWCFRNFFLKMVFYNKKIFFELHTVFQWDNSIYPVDLVSSRFFTCLQHCCEAQRYSLYSVSSCPTAARFAAKEPAVAGWGYY